MPHLKSVWAIKSVDDEKGEVTGRLPGHKRTSVPRIGEYDEDRRNLLSGTDIDTQQTARLYPRGADT